VPPEALTEALPLAPPLQETLLWVSETDIAVGSDKVKLWVVLQPFASVTVTV
jgi:hypothetical protein